MAEPWTQHELDCLEALVAVLLSRPLTTQDLPHVRYALAEQQALVELAYRILGQQKELIEALTREVETLRQVVFDQDDPRPWDDPDDRPW
jgi:hypothetical protein